MRKAQATAPFQGAVYRQTHARQKNRDSRIKNG